MNIKSIEGRVSDIEIPRVFDFEFLYSVLLAYGKPQPSITRLKKGTYNLAEDKEHEVYWKNVVLFRYVNHHDLHITIDDLKRSPYGQKYSPRFIIVTDLDQLLAVDTKTEDTLEIALKDFSRHYAFFLPWAGMEKSQIITENEADVKAAERMAKLYDEIITIEENITDDAAFYHNLNVFFSRLLFCFFAEDTEVFKENQFTRAISNFTQHDGSDLNTFLDELFQALDEKEHDRYPAHIAEFPYVNGGLFRNHIPAPQFNAKARDLIIKCGELNWSEINPDIFGSMIQAVVHPGQRASLGMHYTSVANIMKVIEPLFLEELKESLDKAEGDEQKLGKLLRRIYDIKVFDPACGSGNFLIISFKELRKIEHQILKQIIEINDSKYAGKMPIQIASGLKLENFYGIEIDDFAREVAVLSLWLTKHQMNIEFKKEFGKNIPLIPLKDMGNIICDNAARFSWNDLCPVGENDEIYVIGNPPYQGGKTLKDEQKEDVKIAFADISYSKNIDYISIWFVKAMRYAITPNVQVCFVSTNSITQGEQVAMLWPHLFNAGFTIRFAYTSFKWSNNAKRNAGVTCVIIGFTKKAYSQKTLYVGSIRYEVNHINAYLAANGSDTIIAKRTKPISDIPHISLGSMPKDGGFLIVSREERNELLEMDIIAPRFLRRYVGSQEFIRGEDRYCLWIRDNEVNDAEQSAFIRDRLEKVKNFRLESDAESTRDFATKPYRFIQIGGHQDTDSIIIPRVSSERREYIPIGYLDKNTIIADSANAIYDAQPWVFGLVTSRMHMTWVRAVAGRLKTDIRYSSALTYNNFPVPKLTDQQRQIIANNSFEVLDVREKYPHMTLAELYDPDKMPDDLRRAHHDLDGVVDRCYRVRPFDNDEDRLSHLFKLYEIMTGVQKELLSA